MRKKILSLALALTLLLALVPTALPSAQAAGFTPVTGADMLEKIRLGINFGNTLEATPYNAETGQYSMDPHSLETETCWNEPKIEQWHFKAIAMKGYTAVRLPITWEPHMGDNYKIDKVWMDRIQQCVDWALNEGLYVIINTHHETVNLYEFVMDFNHAEAKTELTAIWAQIAERFKDYSEKLIFEPLNEPHLRDGWIWDSWAGGVGHVSENLVEIVNKLNADALKTIRESGGHNDKRVVVECVPAANCAAIEFYEPPNDPYTMLGVFLYPGDDVNLIRPAVNKGIPVIVKEIAAINNDNPPTTTDAQKLAWTQTTHNALAQMGVPSFWWNHSSSEHNFEVFDRATNNWPRRPLLNAVFTAYGKTPGPDYDYTPPSPLPYDLTGPFADGEFTFWTPPVGALAAAEKMVVEYEGTLTSGYMFARFVPGPWAQYDESDPRVTEEPGKVTFDIRGLAGSRLGFAVWGAGEYQKITRVYIDTWDGADDGLISSAAVTVTAPKTGQAPITAAPTGGTGYTCGAVTWTPAAAEFQSRTAYTASVTLTADAGCTFPSGFTATVNGKTATVTNNTGDTVTISYQFSKTAPTGNGVEVVVDVAVFPTVQVTVLIYYNGVVRYEETFLPKD